MSTTRSFTILAKSRLSNNDFVDIEDYMKSSSERLDPLSTWTDEAIKRARSEEVEFKFPPSIPNSPIFQSGFSKAQGKGTSNTPVVFTDDDLDRSTVKLLR